MIAFILILLQILGVISALDAVMTTRTPQGAIAWSVSLITFPFVAVPAYWVFGHSRFHGVAEAWGENKEELETLFERIVPEIKATFVEQDKRIPEYEALMNLSRMGMTAFNTTTLLIDGEATYDSMLKGISAATDYVLLEFYIVRDDEIGRRLKNALIERAENGVRVYFVYDEFGSKDLSREYGDALRAAGVEFRAFNTTQGMRNRFQLNFRNHRKIVVVDGHRAWVGGLNIGDDYLGGNPKLTPWRDTHLLIEGPAAVQAQVVFFSDWYWATREIIDLDWSAPPANQGDAHVIMIATSPAQEPENAALFFTHAINSAHDRIVITSPYFVPDQGLMNALRLAVLRGVNVKVIVPYVSDSRLVQYAAYHFMEEMADSGVRFYQFQDGFLHQKVMLIDSDIATVGTANFDNRSFRLNFELVTLVRNAGFASEVESMLENDLARSKLVDLDALTSASYWQHIPRRAARLFAPVL